MFSRFRMYVPALIGFSILLLVVDVLVLLFRALGMARGTAVYAGIVVFVVIAFLIARHLIRTPAKSEPMPQPGEVISGENP